MSAETPTFNQLSEQLDAGHRDKMTMLVKGEDGKISTGYFAGKKHAERDEFQVETTAADGTKEFKLLPTEDLSDEKQAELAEELAETREESEIEIEPQVSEEIREDLGEVAFEAAAVEIPVTVEAEDSPETSEFKEAFSVRLNHVVELATSLTDNLKRSSSDMETRHMRRDAVETLSRIISDANEHRSLDLAQVGQVMDTLRRIGQSFHQSKEYMLDEDNVTRTAILVDTARREAEGITAPYVEKQGTELDDKLGDDLHAALITQREIGTNVHDELAKSVGKVDHEDRAIDDALSAITSVVDYLSPNGFDQGAIDRIYPLVQHLNLLVSESDSARHDIDRGLEQIGIRVAALQTIANKLAA